MPSSPATRWPIRTARSTISWWSRPQSGCGQRYWYSASAPAVAVAQTQLLFLHPVPRAVPAVAHRQRRFPGPETAVDPAGPDRHSWNLGLRREAGAGLCRQRSGPRAVAGRGYRAAFRSAVQAEHAGTQEAYLPRPAERGFTLDRIIVKEQWLGKTYLSAFGSFGFTQYFPSGAFYQQVRNLGLLAVGLLLGGVLVYGKPRASGLFMIVLVCSTLLLDVVVAVLDGIVPGPGALPGTGTAHGRNPLLSRKGHGKQQGIPGPHLCPVPDGLLRLCVCGIT